MSYFDDPNREAVGLDPAWVEGSGGAQPAKAAPKKAEPKPAAKAKAKDDEAE